MKYTVKSGDSLYSIAKRFNTTVQNIMSDNNLTSTLIYPGQVLTVHPYGLPSGSYSRGSSGTGVLNIQRALAALGYKVSQNGIYDANTEFIIKSLQQQYPERLSATGTYNSQTRDIIEMLLVKGVRIIRNPQSISALVNKYNGLPPDYVPTDLAVPNVPFSFEGFAPQRQMRAVAATALEKMFAKAKQDGVVLNAVSGYRPYDRQASIFASNISKDPNANRYSARPGESEHQTGLSIDVSSPSINNQLSENFANTTEGKWLAANAPKFGFILRFPKGKEYITGYQYEPWHIRYVGVNPATEITNRGLTLEEYLR